MSDEKSSAKPAAKSKFAGSGKRVTVPMCKLNAGDVIAFHFTGEVISQFIGKPVSDGKFKDEKTGLTYDKDKATLYRATNMDTGEMVDLIGGKVFQSTITRLYGGDIAGKKLVLYATKRTGKGYLDVAVEELA